ncbi:MAG: cellulase family glycosylhydrolase [Candidatus Goldiibacteriota bacterium]|jgi:aryl-phospho-beta-D-glucosidase BglC (GH1 family)
MYLQGVNFGGYLSQADISEKHLKTFITEKDFKQVKLWGFNIVRLPVDYMLFEDDKKPYVYNEARLKYLDNCVDWAEKNDIWLMIDLHKAPGHSFALKERDSNDIWIKKSESRKRFIKIWEFLAARYALRGDKIMYELLNEPVAKKDSEWNSVATDGLNAIRKFDKKHWVVIESNRWGNVHTFKSLKKFNDKKIIYSFHFYEPIVITHQMAEWVGFVKNNIYKKLVDYPGRPADMKGIAEEVAKREKDFAIFFKKQDKYWSKKDLDKMVDIIVRFGKKHRVPVLCGEFGCVAHAMPKTRENWTFDLISAFKKHRISYTYWNYKNMDFGIVDYTKKYKDNPNYASKSRTDGPILKALQSGIL